MSSALLRGTTVQPHKNKLIMLALISSVLATSGCSHFSQANRQQRAYARYIAKCSNTKVRHQAKFKKMKLPAAPTNDAPIMTAGPVDGPQSVSSAAQ